MEKVASNKHYLYWPEYIHTYDAIIPLLQQGISVFAHSLHRQYCHGAGLYIMSVQNTFRTPDSMSSFQWKRRDTNTLSVSLLKVNIKVSGQEDKHEAPRPTSDTTSTNHHNRYY